MPDDRLRPITDRDTGRGASLLRAMMRVTVEDQVGPRVVDGLGQQVAAKEGVDLQPLALEGRLDRRVMQEGDA